MQSIGNLLRQFSQSEAIRSLAWIIVLSGFVVVVALDWTDYAINNISKPRFSCANYSPVLIFVLYSETQLTASLAFLSLLALAGLEWQQLTIRQSLTKWLIPIKRRCFMTSLVTLRIPALILLATMTATFVSPIVDSVKHPYTVQYGVFTLSGLGLELLMACITVGSAAIFFINFVNASFILRCYREAARRLNFNIEFLGDRLAVLSYTKVLDGVRQYHEMERQVMAEHTKMESCVGLPLILLISACAHSLTQTVTALLLHYQPLEDPSYVTRILCKNLFYTYISASLIILTEQALDESSRTPAAWLNLFSRYLDLYTSTKSTSGPVKADYTACARGPSGFIVNSINSAFDSSKHYYRVFNAYKIMFINRATLPKIAMSMVLMMVYFWNRRGGCGAAVNGSTPTNISLPI